MTRAASELFGGIDIVNVGVPGFLDDIRRQGGRGVQVDWRPPGGGRADILSALDLLSEPTVRARIDAANGEAVKRIIEAHPVLVGFGRAIDVVPGMTRDTILHAGPPIAWERMNGAMKGAITGALVFEGLASDLDDAARVAASGRIRFSPCHEHGCVGSMAGVTSASMTMHVVRNKTHGNRAYTNLSEQMAKILRMGANDRSVIDRLCWMRDVLGPILQAALEHAGEIDLRLLLAQALHMGDECHNRNTAGTGLLSQALTPHILETPFTTAEKKQVFEFMASSDYFSGPTWMALCKCALDAAHGVEGSSIVTTMCRNGVEFGIRVSGIPGNTWFTGPAQPVIGPMFAGYKAEDSGLDIGDSAITETYGLGGFAMVAAPAIVALIGGTVGDAMAFTLKMEEITATTNPNVTIPLLNFRGIATGIDVRKVVQSGVLPVISTAIAHREPGIGMIGAGITYPPLECFEHALLALVHAYAPQVQVPAGRR